MPNNIRYNISVLYFDDTEKRKEIKEERVIKSFDNLDDAIRALIKIGIQEDYLMAVDFDEVKDDIEEHREAFERGTKYRILFDTIHDSVPNGFYVGPGAYTLSRTVLQ